MSFKCKIHVIQQLKFKEKAACLANGLHIGVNESISHDTNIFGNTTIFFRKIILYLKKQLISRDK